MRHLGGDGGPGEERAEEQEGRDLPRDPAEAGPRAGQGHAAQRVHVQQDEDGGKRHHDGLGGQRQPERDDRGGQPAASRRALGLDGAQVEEHRHEQEGAGHEVAALRHPGDRLDPEGMDREEEGRARRGDRERPPGQRGRAAEEPRRDETEEPRVEGVQNHVRQVVADGVHAPRRVVERERQPRRRNVVPHVEGGGHPAEPVPAESPVVRIREQVRAVVPDEAVVERGQEDQEADARDHDRGCPGQTAHRAHSTGNPAAPPRLPRRAASRPRPPTPGLRRAPVSGRGPASAGRRRAGEVARRSLGAGPFPRADPKWWGGRGRFEA